MKKLLSLLSVLTISGTAVPTVIAASPYKKQEKLNEDNNYQKINNLENLNRNKKETNSFDDYLEFNNKHINKVKVDIKDKYSAIVDKNKNIYINTKYNAYILKYGETTAIKINGINNNINSMIFDNYYNIYIGTNDSIYFLKYGETTATKIERIPLNEKIIIGVDKNNNLYFRILGKSGAKTLSNSKDEEIYVLKNGIFSLINIEGIKDFQNAFWIFSTFFIKNNLYISGSEGIYVLKDGETTAKKIKSIIGQIMSISINNKNDLYIGTYIDGLYKLKYGEITATKIFETNNNISLLKIDSDDNLYFQAHNELYRLKYDEITPQKIKLINTGKIEIASVDKNNNLYFKIYNNIYFLEKRTYVPKQINLNLDNIKSIIFDYDNNVYFNTTNDIYFLEYGETTPIKINKITYDITIDMYYNVYFFTNEGIFILEKDYEKIIKKIELKNLKVQDNFIFDNQNNIYFIATDTSNSSNNIYFLKKGTTIPIKILLIDNSVLDFVIDNQNNIYFYKKNSVYVLKHHETTPTKIEGILNDVIKGLYIDNQNNVYIRTYHDGLYKLNNNLIALKINGINDNPLRGNEALISSFPVVFDKNNNVYFTSTKSVYVLKNGETTATKIEGEYETLINWFFLIDNENNIYFGSKGHPTNIYKINQGETTAKKINWNKFAFSSAFDSKNNMYIGTNDSAYVLNHIDLTTTKINGINEAIWNIVIDKNDNVYFETNSGVYVLKNGELTVSKVNEITHSVTSLAVDKNDNIYFKELQNNIFWILQNKLNFQDNIKITNIEKINNNSDKTILNTLNYLNRENNYFLNLNKMKVINKTSTFATIEAVKGKYRGQVTVNYKIKNKDEISNIDLNDLLQKAIYFDFIDKNFYSIDKIKEIKNINIDNLNFSNVEVTRKSKLSHSIDFKDACFKKKTFTNISSKDTQKRKVPKCDYSTKSKLEFQIITGLTKINQENKQNGWNINLDDEIKLSDFININNKDYEIINTLSDNFDLSNTNKQEQEMILQSFNEDDYEISIDPKTKLEIKNSVREINLKTILNLKQKITGTITAKIIDDNNEEQIITLSIKEAMQILQKYSLLSDEITINEDNSITFNGKAKISLTQEAEPQLITKISNI